MKAAAVVLLLLLTGWLVPRLLIRDGVDQFTSDPAAHLMAQEALVGARQFQDNPIARLLTPASRVVEVRQAPGHCSPSEPGGKEQYAAWRARVAFYTFFALPAGSIHVTCGGWHLSRYSPED